MSSKTMRWLVYSMGAYFFTVALLGVIDDFSQPNGLAKLFQLVLGVSLVSLVYGYCGLKFIIAITKLIKLRIAKGSWGVIFNINETLGYFTILLAYTTLFLYKQPKEMGIEELVFLLAILGISNRIVVSGTKED